MFNPDTISVRLIAWLREKVEKSQREGLIFGLSGGVDSAVVGALAVRAFPVGALGLIMPCESDPQDRADALLVAEHLNLPVLEVDLTNAYRQFLSALREEGSQEPGDLNTANLKPRLRMTALYYYAARQRYLVTGTSNASELVTGYFTKYGDSGADILPVASLVKQEVLQLGEFLGVPGQILTKPPSGGLWSGQTDEGEMGVTYKAIDAYLRGGRVKEEDRQRIAAMEERSRHKRSVPEIFDATGS